MKATNWQRYPLLTISVLLLIAVGGAVFGAAFGLNPPAEFFVAEIGGGFLGIGLALFVRLLVERILHGEWV